MIYRLIEKGGEKILTEIFSGKRITAQEEDDTLKKILLKGISPGIFSNNNN